MWSAPTPWLWWPSTRGVDLVVIDSTSLVDHVSLYQELLHEAGMRQVSWRDSIVPRLLVSNEEREKQKLARVLTPVVVLVYNGSSNHYDAAMPIA
jgi:hypothetical protein